MFKYLKRQTAPDSSPDMLTFPFRFGPFQFTMENFVRSYTRKRVTKDNLDEILEEINLVIKSEGSGFKCWDWISVLVLILINVGIIGCVATLKIDDLILFAVKVAIIFVCLIMNFSIYMCCLNSATNRLRDKIQEILDIKDEYFSSKGMKWAICSETDFPYWIELHVQSQFEIKIEKDVQRVEGKKKPVGEKDRITLDAKGILADAHGGNSSTTNILSNNKQLFRAKPKGMIRQQINDDELCDTDNQTKPVHTRKESDTNINFDRLYGPLEEDYEEVYEDETPTS